MADIYFSDDQDVYQGKQEIIKKQNNVSYTRLKLQDRKNVISQRNFNVKSLRGNLFQNNTQQMINYDQMESVVKQIPIQNKNKIKQQNQIVRKQIKIKSQVDYKIQSDQGQPQLKPELNNNIFIKKKEDLYFQSDDGNQLMVHTTQKTVDQQQQKQLQQLKIKHMTLAKNYQEGIKQLNQLIKNPNKISNESQKQLTYEDLQFSTQLYLMPVPKNCVFRCTIIRKFTGFLNNVEFDLFVAGSPIMLAKKKMGLKLEYKIKGRTDKKTFNKLGFVISDISRNKFHLYLYNFNKIIDSNLNQDYEKINATIQYSQQNSIRKRPKRICVYLPNPQTTTFSTIKTDNLIQSHLHPTNQVKFLINRKAIWSKQLNLYTLNFYGRASVASIKNFQLVEDQQSLDVPNFLFGKKDQNIFNVDIRYPLSIIQGFGLALTSFDFKFSL